MKQDFVMGLARHVLTTGGGVLVAKGVLYEQTAGQLAGALLTLVGIAWSMPDKKN